MAPQYPDLRDINHFPGFAGIPTENLDTGVITPGTDGCLLLEIVAFETSPTLVVGTRSKDLHLVTLRFEGEDQGRALAQSPHLKVGHTIAILHARKHQFGHQVYGIRLYNYRSLKILPGGLDEILHLSDELRAWPLNFAPHQKCHWCAAETDTIITCNGCGVIGYCGTACQLASWNIRNHKEMCKVVGDQNFRSLMVEMAYEEA